MLYALIAMSVIALVLYLRCRRQIRMIHRLRWVVSLLEESARSPQ